MVPDDIIVRESGIDMRHGLCAVFVAATLCMGASAFAADASAIEAAKRCVAIASDGEGGFARAQWHQRQVACLTDLYVMIGIGPNGGAAAVTEIRAHLDNLEAAYYNSRALCMTKEKHGDISGGCGTISLAPAEFRRLLKTMILNADTGWVTEDQRLRDALKLRD